MSGSFRVGSGFDVHRLEEGRHLVLGGVEVPSQRGAVGHSDGDCLLHALTDALLGAVAAGDIGEHFSDADPAFADAPSGRFVREAARLVANRGYAPVNVDATVFLEEPRLSALKVRMARNIAVLLDLDPQAVSVKAKTGEGLGAIGTARAVAAQVTVLVRRSE